MKYFLTISIFLSSFVLADSSIPIRERIKWADENKCQMNLDGKIMPFIPFLAALYNEKGIDNTQIKEKISAAVARGCDVNATDQAGLSAINVGILFNQPDIVQLMLSLGANPKLAIKRESGQFSGLNSYEFVDMLISLKKPRKEIQILFNQVI